MAGTVSSIQSPETPNKAVRTFGKWNWADTLTHSIHKPQLQQTFPVRAAIAAPVWKAIAWKREVSNSCQSSRTHTCLSSWIKLQGGDFSSWFWFIGSGWSKESKLYTRRCLCSFWQAAVINRARDPRTTVFNLVAATWSKRAEDVNVIISLPTQYSTWNKLGDIRCCQ